MSAPLSFGYRVFPHSKRGGTTVSWSAVVHDLTCRKELLSGPLYKFVTRTAPFPSPQQASEAALRLCRKYSQERRLGIYQPPSPIRG